MAETAKAQEPSMEELRARISRIIIDADDTAAPPPTEPPLQRLDPGSYASSDDQVSAAAISDWPSGLLNTAAAIASSTPQSIGTSSDPTPAPASASGLYARESGSAPLFGYAGKQVPMPSMLHAAPAEKEQREEPLIGQAGQQVVTSTRGRAAPGGGNWEQLISRETNNAVHSAFDALAQTVLLHNARTLEDMVREMLRPILKVWLNDNLPSIVEHLVRGEIERTRRPVRGKPGEG